MNAWCKIVHVVSCGCEMRRKNVSCTLNYRVLGEGQGIEGGGGGGLLWFCSHKATLRKGWVLEGSVLAPVRSVTAETGSGDRVKIT